MAWQKGHFVSDKTRKKISETQLTISWEQENQIIKLYKNLTIDEISSKLNLSRYVIYGCLHRHKIKMRPTGMRTGRIPWNKDTKGVCKSNNGSFKKGSIPWNKGKIGIYSEEHLKQMSKSHKGHISWMKGKKHTEATRRKISESRKGKLTGCNHPKWKGGVSRASKTGYYSVQYKEWRRKVFERDNYTCQICGAHNGNGKFVYLTAHHKKSFSKYPKLRFDVNNGLTVCELCHCKIDKYRARFMNGEL